MNVEETKKEEQLKRIDYRHYISVLITIVFIAFGVYYFPNAICRLIESCRDFCYSVAYYFAELFFDENPVIATVNNLPVWQITTSKYQPLNLLPIEFEDFKIKVDSYINTFAKWETVQAYLYFLADLLYFVALFFLDIV